MTPRLYISDLDGTLLDPDAQLSPRTRSGLERLLVADVPFTIATARHPQSIRMILGDLPLRLPVVALHGALLTDMASLAHLHVRAIERDAALGVLDIARRHGTSAWVSTTTGTADHVTYDAITNAGMQWYLDDRTRVGDPRLRRAADLTTVFVDAVTCITVMAPEDVTRAIGHDVANEHAGAMKVHVYENAYSPGWWWMTAHSAEAGKDVGVGDLLARHEFDDHEIVAFGDTTGDLPLFAAAHRRVAVANAERELKDAACETIGAHDEDSVIDYLLRDAGLDDTGLDD
jgi:hydroxymethylpyrimidine pyrophosphatase-like HAD family hydrolase